MFINTVTNHLLASIIASPGAIVLYIFIGLIVGCGLAIGGFAIYIKIRKIKLANLKDEAVRIKEDATQEARTIRKEAQLEAKEEQHKMRAEFDAESKERRIEIQRSEQRIAQKEENLGKKEDAIDRRQEALDKLKQQMEKKETEILKMDAEVKSAHNLMVQELEKVAQMTKEEAGKQLNEMIIDQVRRDSITAAKEIENTAKEEAEKRAKEIVGLAVQKCATDHAQELAVSVVALPNEDMKGRIIGRVGRNIRALENATGVDVIIDDTPDVVTLSGFDPVRREIAKVSLERLVADGRIHPARIEEVVDKVKHEINNQIKEAGDQALFEAGVFSMHAELARLVGRLKYRTSYGQNVLKHSLEVAHLAGVMASELGADIKVCKRAGLLHDIGKAVDSEIEGPHALIGEELAKRFKENWQVVHAIAAHHQDVEPKTIEAVIVQAADAISGARTGARRESLENYVKRLENLEHIANSFPGVEQSFAIQAGREIRVMVKPEKIDDKNTYFVAKDIAKKIEEQLDYPGQIKVIVIREFRSIEYAK